MAVWHIVYIGGLLLALAAALWGTRGAWGWREAALVAIVAILIPLYVRVIVFAFRWPYPRWFWALYYGIVIALLALAVWINPVFIWAIAMLFGQMSGVLPPLLAFPGVLAVMGVILLAANDWRLPAQISWGGVAFVAAQLGIMFVLYLYIYHVFRTSQERAELVNELTAAKSQLERARDAEAELATLRERERVARDLHDGLGHSLVTLSMQLEAVQRLYPVDPERASAQLDEMKQLTRDSMTQLRQTLDGLRAPGLADQALSRALRLYCADFSRRAGLTVTCDVDSTADGLPAAMTEALWRISVEALTNIERHAQASSVALRLRIKPDAVSLYIEDDGIGLPPDAENRPGHYGLRGIRERVEGLGGTLTMGRVAKGGSFLAADIPGGVPGVV